MKRRFLLSFGVAALCLTATPVMADLCLDLNISPTTFSYVASTHQGTVALGTGSQMVVSLTTDAGIMVDNAIVSPGSGSEQFSITFTPIAFSKPVGSDWQATGGIAIMNGGSTRVAATFNSTNIALTKPFLTIQGGLTPTGTNSSILVGSPWVFKGSGEDDSYMAPGGSDGVANQVTALPVPSFSEQATLLSVSFGLGALSGVNSLDVFFSANRSGSTGNLDVTTNVVPIPGAVLLGFLGLSAAGLGLRKLA